MIMVVTIFFFSQVFYWKLLFLRCENMRKFLTGFRFCSLCKRVSVVCVRSLRFFVVLDVFQIIRSRINVGVIKQWIMRFPGTPREKNNNIDQHAINNNSKGIFINRICRILKQIMAEIRRIDKC